MHLSWILNGTTGLRVSSVIVSMIALIAVPFVAAVGYSLVYLLAGGGLGGAILIFIVAKLLGK